MRKAPAPKIPKGYKPVYTTYELITKTTLDKPFKMPKESKSPARPKQYVQPVRIVNPPKKRAKKGR